jgi:hypothetical protein
MRTKTFPSKKAKTRQWKETFKRGIQLVRKGKKERNTSGIHWEGSECDESINHNL